MDNFKFLTKEQWEDNDLNFLKRRGAAATITDFSILFGGFVSREFVANGNGSYWLKSRLDYRSVYSVCPGGPLVDYDINNRAIGARPIIMRSFNISVNEAQRKTQNGVLEVEYGYYPQKAVPKDI